MVYCDFGEIMLWSEGEEDDEERMYGLVMDIGIYVVLWGKVLI